MARYALCVGINEFKSLPRSSWLSGCVNDANDISKALKKYGFTARNCRCSATRTPQAESDGSPEGDGGQGEAGGPRGVHVLQPRDTSAERSRRPDEPDGLDEAFACYDIRRAATDWDRKTVIVDDEGRELFGLVPEGVLVEVVLDTCHSGTGTKDLEDLQQAMLLGRRPRYLPPPTPKGPLRSRSLRTADKRKVDRKALVELTKTKGPAPSRCCTPRAAPSRPPRTRGSTVAPTVRSPSCSSRHWPRRDSKRSQLPAAITRGSRAATSSSARRSRAREGEGGGVRPAVVSRSVGLRSGSVVAHPAAQRLDLRAPALALDPAALRALGRLGRHPGERRWRQAVAELLGEPLAGGDAVAVLRAVLGGGRPRAGRAPSRRITRARCASSSAEDAARRGRARPGCRWCSPTARRGRRTWRTAPRGRPPGSTRPSGMPGPGLHRAGRCRSSSRRRLRHSIAGQVSITIGTPAARVRSKASWSITPSWNHTPLAPTATASSANWPAALERRNTSTTSIGERHVGERGVALLAQHDRRVRVDRHDLLAAFLEQRGDAVRRTAGVAGEPDDRPGLAVVEHEAGPPRGPASHVIDGPTRRPSETAP